MEETNTQINEQSESEASKKEDSKEDSKKLLILIGIVLVAFVLFFIGFNIFSPDDQKVITIEDLHKMNLNGELKEDQGYLYNGFSFVKHSNLWNTKILRDDTEFDLNLHYGPREVEDIQIKGNGELDKSEIYIAFDFSNESKPMGNLALAGAELSLSLAKGLNIVPIAACINDQSETCIDRPIVGCEDNDKDIIILLEQDPTDIIFKDNCVTISGKEKNIIKAVDRFLLRWYGIVE